MDKKEVNHIAKLARLKFDDDELSKISADMSGILKMVDILQSANTSAIANTCDELPALRTRKDEVTVSGISEDLTQNATEPYEHFYTVPRMVE